MRHLLILVILSLPFQLQAESDNVSRAKVGIRHFPPCVKITEVGTYSGFEIEFWREIGRRTQIEYDFVTMEFSDIVGTDDSPSKIITGEIDIAFSGISITSKRAELFDFCHTHLSTGLKIVSDPKFKIPVKKIGIALAGFLLIIAVAGIVLWRLERGNELIKDDPFPGIFEGMWCVLTTISTVGYGQVAPVTWKGRAFTALVMVTGIGYFCTVASKLTAEAAYSIQTYQTLDELKFATVAAKRHSTSAEIAKNNAELIVLTDSADEAITLVERKKVDAALVDAPVADDRLKRGSRIILSDIVSRQDYGILLRKGDKRREIINHAILEMIEDGTYDDIYRRWF